MYGPFVNPRNGISSAQSITRSWRSCNDLFDTHSVIAAQPLFTIQITHLNTQEAIFHFTSGLERLHDTPERFVDRHRIARGFFVARSATGSQIQLRVDLN